MPPRESPETSKSSKENAKLRLRWARFNTNPENQKSFGLVSRGDSSLQSSSRKRIQFFDEILKSFKAFEANQPDSNDSNKLSSLESLKKTEPEPEISSTLRNLRTLREALLAHKPDDFTKRVFLFSIRIAATVRHYETYVASILFLLNNARHLLTPSEEQEIAWILIVHTSHFNGDNYRSLLLFFKYLSEQTNVYLYNLLQAWINDDYYTWLQHFNTESNLGIHAIMTFGVDRMMKCMINSVSNSYFTFPKKNVKHLLPRGENWLEFKKTYDIKWEEDEVNILVRPRGKPVKADCRK